MTVSGRTLQDSFDLRGSFWLPEEPDTKVAGTVRVTPTRIELDLLGALGGTQRVDAIHGTTHDGPCTLASAFVTGMTTSFTEDGDVQHSSWQATALFVGVTADAPDALPLTSCAYGFES